MFDFNGRSIFITGGAGTLGRAFIERMAENGTQCNITIFSTDAIKHQVVRARFPSVHSVIGDIRDFSTVYNAMAGHDVVIHAAAVKHIPVSEQNSIDTFQINVDGSQNVAQAAIQLGVPEFLAISTDKACHPANAYGATKMLMEKIVQEYARMRFQTRFHLVRYGNVLESTGSVVEMWHKAIVEQRPIRLTDPQMTRFWLSPRQAVDLVCHAFDLQSGHILIAKMPALSIAKLAEYTVGVKMGEHQGMNSYPVEFIPLRPGEKMHETLLTIEETAYAADHGDYFDLRPSTDPRNPPPNDTWPLPYTSDNPVRELDLIELRELLKDS